MSHDASPRVLHLVGQDSAPFEEIFAVEDPAVLSRALEIIAAIQPAVDAEHVFELSRAVEIVKADPQLVLLQLRDSSATYDHMRVERMVELVAGEINNLLAVALPDVTQEQLRATVTNIFTNLEPQQAEGWLHLEPRGSSTSYQYNVVYVVQNQETGWLFYVAPLGLTITVDVDQQQLFSLALHDTVNYRIRLQAMTIGALVDQPPTRGREP